MMRDRPPVLRQIGVALLLLALVAAIALLGSLASTSNVDGWYAEAEKVPWDPPNAVFGPVWSVLYALIALAGWLFWRRGWRQDAPNAARRELTVFGVQLLLNAMWTPLFFAGYPVVGAPAWWAALVVIVALVVVVAWLALRAARWSRIVSAIMVVYLLWLLFATSLNVGIIALN